MFIITSNNKTPQSLRICSCLHLHRWWNNWWQLTQGGSEISAVCAETLLSINNHGRGLRPCDATWTDSSIWERVKILVDKKKKHWLDFYHYRVVVYTHCQHTFQFKQLVKVHVALHDSMSGAKITVHTFSALILYCAFFSKTWQYHFNAKRWFALVQAVG